MSKLFVTLLVIAFLVFIGSAMRASYQAGEYVKELRRTGVACERRKEDSGPPHSRMTYWICDNGETVESRWFTITNIE